MQLDDDLAAHVMAVFACRRKARSAYCRQSGRLQGSGRLLVHHRRIMHSTGCVDREEERYRAVRAIGLPRGGLR